MIYLYLLTYFKLKRNKISGYIFYSANTLRNKELKTINNLLNLYELGLSEIVKLRLFTQFTFVHVHQDSLLYNEQNRIYILQYIIGCYNYYGYVRTL